MDAFIRTEIVRLNRRLAALVGRGRTAEAIQTALQICDVIRRHLGEDDPLLASALSAVGDVYAGADDLAAAETFYERAVATATRAPGDDHPALVPLWEKLARVKTALGKQGEAQAIYGRSMETRRGAMRGDKAASSSAGPARGGEVMSGRGSASADAGERDRKDGGVRATVSPFPRLPARGLPARVGDFCQALATRLRRRDLIECSVFAPAEVAAGQLLFVQVFAHRPHQRRETEREAARADREAELRGRRSLRTPVGRGAQLGFHLHAPGLEIDAPHESLIWQGRPEAVQFGVRVPQGHAPGVVVATVTASIDGAPVGHVKFKLTVVAGASDTSSTTPPTRSEHRGDPRRYRRAFVCYASKDRAEVIRRSAILRIAGVRVFQDVFDLDPGERWEKKLYEFIDQCDLFLLFWSLAAKDSEWVEKEVRYACELKHGDDMRPPEICPVILESPPAPPPAELAHLHFNDWRMYLAHEPTSAPARSPAGSR